MIASARKRETLMTPQEFRRQLDELQRIISEGVAYFSAWQALTPKDDDSAQALNRYKGLFTPARAALIWMAINQLAKVFDSRRGTVSLRNLLKAAKRDCENLTPFGSMNDLKRIDDQLTSNQPLLEKLKHLRNQRLAHHAAIVSGEMSLLYGETSRLLGQVKSMYNSLSHGNHRGVTMFDHLASETDRHAAAVVHIVLKQEGRIRKANLRLEDQTRQ